MPPGPRPGPPPVTLPGSTMILPSPSGLVRAARKAVQVCSEESWVARTLLPLCSMPAALRPLPLVAAGKVPTTSCVCVYPDTF